LTSARIVVVTLLLAACSRGIADLPSGVFFPTVPIGDAYPAAQFQGVLEVVEVASSSPMGASGGSPYGQRDIASNGQMVRSRSGTAQARSSQPKENDSSSAVVKAAESRLEAPGRPTRGLEI
jgi:hypothetical protein